LGNLYLNGRGVPQDYELARQWYEKAAAIGDSRGMEILARDRYEKAAATGDSEAMYNLGLSYKEGRMLGADFAKAHEWFEKAAIAGNTRAMVSLGFLYQEGRGTAPDYIQARKWFEKAKAAGDAGGKFGLGYLYMIGGGVAKDYTQARKWFMKAAAAGNAEAMRYLGILYENGEGVAKDPAQAQKWYQKASAAGDKYSRMKLANDYVFEQMRKEYPNGPGGGSSGSDRVFPLGPLVTAPVPVYTPDPKYSAEALRKHLQGVVVVYLVVDASGHPKNIALVRGLGMGLDENAIAAVKTWLFKPGIKDGQPVSVGMNVEVTFQLLGNQEQPEHPPGG